MDIILSLAAVLGALLIGAMSPGASFVLVARTAVVVSRRDGVLSALGMGTGGFLFALLALLGLEVLLAGVPRLYIAMKLAGGIYLAYIALRIWRGAGEEIAVGNPNRKTAPTSFLRGFFTQVSNPKTALVYGGVFSALLPRDMPLSALMALPFLVFLLEAGWYSVVAVALSAPSSRAAYLRVKGPVDRAAASIIGLLGVKLLLSARS